MASKRTDTPPRRLEYVRLDEIQHAPRNAAWPQVGDRYGPWRVIPGDAVILVRVSVACASCGVIRMRTINPGMSYSDTCPDCGSTGSNRRKPDGRSKDPIYTLWRSMVHRAGPSANEKTRRRYYDRGIRVCDEWTGSWDAFHDWCVDNGWARGLHLDRIDNDGNYEPGNCRFVTPVKNHANRSATFRITAWGETKPLSEWLSDERCHASYFQIHDRLTRHGKRAWTPEEAITTPPAPRTQRKPLSEDRRRKAAS